MAVIVLGAGATRGCSFVPKNHSECLPPLDSDFFTQLQRIRNPKHKDLIDKVLADVVDVFGLNFSVTMETVFTTLEHTIRMIELAGDNRGFKKSDLKAKRDRLVQAIAAVLEASLTPADAQGHSSREMYECEFHSKLVKNILKPNDVIVSFNYDCTIDKALKDYGDKKWSAQFGYGFKLNPKSSNLIGYTHWQPSKPASRGHSVQLYKLHGSLHFHDNGCGNPREIKLKQRPYTKQSGQQLRFTIIPPEWNKTYDDEEGVFANQWRKAATAINKAEQFVFIGYSLPYTDLHSTALFRTALGINKIKSIVLVNPDRLSRQRIRKVVQRGMNPATRVLSYDYFSDFIDVDQKLWRQ